MAGHILFLRRNSLLVLLALALSWLIWVQVSTFFQETWRGEIPVRIIAENEKGTLILSCDPERVTVELYGSRRDIERARGVLAAEIRIRPESLSPEQKTVRFTAEDLEFPPGLELVSMEPPGVSVTFAKWAEKKVRVEVDSSGLDQNPDLKYVDAVAWPEWIRIEGPEQIVSSVPGVQTVPIDLNRYSTALETDAELETEIDLDLGRWAETGLIAPIRRVRVRLRFEHVTRRDVWVPLEVHWVDPHAETNARCFRIEPSASKIVEEKEGRLKIRVSLTGPKAVLDDDTQTSLIRAYVRSDEADKEIGKAPVRFENLPEGVTVVPIQPGHRPNVTLEKAYELKRDE